MITPADVLREAQALFGMDDGDEVRRRTAVSRAYYAAYHHARCAAEADGYREDGKASVHWQLQRHYSGKANPKQRRIAQFLRNLKGLRVRADYRLSEALSVSEAREALSLAAHIVTQIDRISQDKPA
ncbi:HEPN domain-containing protein [Roseomonas genomospecies 6]|uniref:HEPN domain-containing protein n=1 Tax=Roseomonas genomospecies 6 TaxID=214106 RepID=A0A9W7NJ88_9PROT|nr:HEPN domain-containing protein [Roseomonas genomospecies 6]KAA0680326.1 HEPN domain-containing protein [Roseomonas genomospecies 6]